MGTWEVFIKDHHEGYISWAEYERNQALLAGNAYGRVGDTKSGRGGRALLAGLICCARCGRRLSVLYTGRYPRPIYRCEQPNVQLGQRRCLSVAGKRIDETIAAEMLRAVAPMAIEAAEEAERMLRDEDQERRRIAELELQQAQYDASLAERRYAACDPDNRLIAAQLEKAWETSLQRVECCRERLDRMQTSDADDMRPDFTGLADDLSAAWKAPRTTMRTRQRLVRALITEIIVDIDDAAGEIVLVIHWKGGQQSELRIRKPRIGEHGCSTPEQALAVIRSRAMVRPGHRCVSEPSPPVRFRRAAGMLSLPVPLKGGSIEALTSFFNLPTRSDFVLVVAWLLAALRQWRAYPLLAVSGEQGSAKTVLSKILRALIDPNAAPVRTAPREERDLFIAAGNGHLLVFDNLSDITACVSDALCRLASGGSFAVRQI
jgi:hypothetical protein